MFPKRSRVAAGLQQAPGGDGLDPVRPDGPVRVVVKPAGRKHGHPCLQRQQLALPLVDAVQGFADVTLD